MKRMMLGLIVSLSFMGAVAPTVQAKDRCHTKSCEHRVVQKHKVQVVAPYRSIFNRIASCESGGRWYIATGNGFYGGIQFTVSSWHAVGGWGMPHRNTKLEQMYRGVKLMRKQGWGAWPVCAAFMH